MVITKRPAGTKEFDLIAHVGGKCPACGGNVYDAGMNYICEKATGPDKTCKFRSGKIILQQTIEPAQIQKLLATGKTDLLKGFVSKKNNRKFEAFLVLKDGKTAFEFAPREKKGRAGAVKTNFRTAAED